MGLDFERLYKLAPGINFRAAKPFPHVVIDGFLDDPEQALRAIPLDGWKHNENKHTVGKGVTKVKSPIWPIFNNDAKSLFAELFSDSFLKFLEIISGIHGLLPDPYFQEGGFHSIKTGGRLSPHADFSHHRLGLERRLNLLLYLNKDWKEEFGGHLSLYDASMNQVVKVLPVLNRCVIFETSDTSYHGHPEPLRSPPGVNRNSIALYYYSMPTGRPVRKIFFPGDPKFDPNA